MAADWDKVGEMVGKIANVAEGLRVEMRGVTAHNNLLATALSIQMQLAEIHRRLHALEETVRKLKGG